MIIIGRLRGWLRRMSKCAHVNISRDCKMDKKESIKLFVQDSLGCKCPEEVFHHIERISGSVGVESEPYSEKLVVGRRLLIYILRLQDRSSVCDYLPRMLEMGIKERDVDGLNRFRAVLATPDPQGLKPIAEKIFSQLDIRDDKVHLHIVDSKKLPG